MRRALAPAAFSIVLAARVLEAQAPAPTPPSADLRALIKEGNALHDRGDYDGALAKYREALVLDPGNPEALYETAFSLDAEKKLDAALAAAHRGLERPSATGPALWMLIGNIQDELGERAKAVEAYEAGIALNPRTRLLHFNLGVTCVGLGDLDRARAAFEAELDLNPNHAGSHYSLGRTYMRQGYRVPALLAFARFLALEPRTKRSTQAIAWMDEIFGAGVEQKGERVNLTLASSPTDEGDFASVDLVVLMAQAIELDPAAAAKIASDPPGVRRLATVLQAAGEIGDASCSNGFAPRHYVPYFGGLASRSLTTPFAYWALQSSPDESIPAWLAKNRKSLERLAAWSSDYRWTEPPLADEGDSR